ncbi:MAG: hypothetical protein K6T80_05415 [Firmicutes bacterium]|nr:hypothetical protein [Bacillota bacterium]
MGVVVGRIGRVEESFLERGLKMLAGIAGKFAGYAENYGLAVAAREVESRKELPLKEIVDRWENYGVETCKAAVNFWK